MSIIGQISVGDGATFTPAVDSDGVISWTNNKNLTNPASVDIPQAVIDRYQLAPTSNPTFTGTVTAEDITASGTITGNVTGTASGNLPLSGGTITGDLEVNGNITQNGNDTLQKAVLLWSNANGQAVGSSFTLSKSSVGYNAFIIMVCADLTDSNGSAIGIFATRMGYELTSTRVRGQNGNDFAGSSATNYDWRTVCVDISLNGTSATVNSCSLVRNNNGTMSKTTRVVYAIYGLNFVIA